MKSQPVKQNEAGEGRRQIAAEVLRQPIPADGFISCPGEHLHTKRNGRRDCLVKLDGAPTLYCVHSSCGGVLADVNRELRRRIAAAERGEHPAPILGNALPPEPKADTPKRPPYDPERLRKFASGCPVRGDLAAWLAERSPVPIPAEHEQDERTAALFLNSLFRPGERVLCFTKNFSQGDFLHEAGRGSFRLAARPGVRAVPSPLPAGGPEGVWFLIQPVTGQWLPNHNNRGAAGEVRLGRRHAACVSRWPHLLLESDEAPAELWLPALVRLPLPVVAIFTSGGRSVHALLRIEAAAKPAWDALRDDLSPIVCPLGADGGALSAVRLARLPGCLRYGTRDREGAWRRYDTPRRQRLLWLDPAAPCAPILGRVAR